VRIQYSDGSRSIPEKNVVDLSVEKCTSLMLL
jgi:hypothetical protein